MQMLLDIFMQIEETFCVKGHTKDSQIHYGLLDGISCLLILVYLDRAKCNEINTHFFHECYAPYAFEYGTNTIHNLNAMHQHMHLNMA